MNIDQHKFRALGLLELIEGTPPYDTIKLIILKCRSLTDLEKALALIDIQIALDASESVQVKEVIRIELHRPDFMLKIAQLLILRQLLGFTFKPEQPVNSKIKRQLKHKPRT